MISVLDVNVKLSEYRNVNVGILLEPKCVSNMY